MRDGVVGARLRPHLLRAFSLELARLLILALDGSQLGCEGVELLGYGYPDDPLDRDESSAAQSRQSRKKRNALGYSLRGLKTT